MNEIFFSLLLFCYVTKGEEILLVIIVNFFYVIVISCFVKSFSGGRTVTGIAQASSVKVLQTNLKSNLAEESPDDQAPDHLMTINISTFC